MSTVTTAATVAQPVATGLLGAAVAYIARQVGKGRFDRAVTAVVHDLPVVEQVAGEAEKVPAVRRAVEDVEAAAKAEADRLNAASHGAIDAVAEALAVAVPKAIQDAIVQAHTAIPAPAVPALNPPAAPAVRVDTPGEVTVVPQQ